MADEKLKPCYICWFFTITLSITTGTLLVDALKAGKDYFSLLGETSNSIQNSNGLESSDDTTTSVDDNKNKESETVKLSPDGELPVVKLSPKKNEMPEQDVYIKVLPDNEAPKKDTAKENMPGYKTTLEICNYWKKEYEKEATKQNSAYMQAACGRLESYK